MRTLDSRESTQTVKNGFRTLFSAFVCRLCSVWQTFESENSIKTIRIETVSTTCVLAQKRLPAETGPAQIFIGALARLAGC